MSFRNGGKNNTASNRHTDNSSGLGLSIAARIIQEHGGSLSVTSLGPTMGCTASFYVPLEQRSNDYSGNASNSTSLRPPLLGIHAHSRIAPVSTSNQHSDHHGDKDMESNEIVHKDDSGASKSMPSSNKSNDNESTYVSYHGVTFDMFNGNSIHRNSEHLYAGHSAAHQPGDHTTAGNNHTPQHAGARPPANQAQHPPHHLSSAPSMNSLGFLNNQYNNAVRAMSNISMMSMSQRYKSNNVSSQEVNNAPADRRGPPSNSPSASSLASMFSNKSRANNNSNKTDTTAVLVNVQQTNNGPTTVISSAANHGEDHHEVYNLQRTQSRTQPGPFPNIQVSSSASVSVPLISQSTATVFLLRKVLVVDDSKLARTMICSMLTKLGFTCDEAANGSEAVELMQAARDAHVQELELQQASMLLLSGGNGSAHSSNTNDNNKGFHFTPNSKNAKGDAHSGGNASRALGKVRLSGSEQPNNGEPYSSSINHSNVSNVSSKASKPGNLANSSNENPATPSNNLFIMEVSNNETNSNRDAVMSFRNGDDSERSRSRSVAYEQRVNKNTNSNFGGAGADHKSERPEDEVELHRFGSDDIEPGDVFDIHGRAGAGGGVGNVAAATVASFGTNTATSMDTGTSDISSSPHQHGLPPPTKVVSSARGSLGLFGYCLIMMDNVMPRKDGPTAVKEIRAMGYQGPIIGVTGNTLPSDVTLFMDAGLTMVAPKPLLVQQFKQILQSLEIPV
jgi:CheY-like chemotaxis protein